MKKTIFLLICAITLLLFASSAIPLTITQTPNDIHVEIGKTFTVGLYLTGINENFETVAIDLLTYDHSVIHLKKVEKGTLFEDWIFWIAGTIDNAKGELIGVCGATTVARNTGGLFINLTFEGIANGFTYITVNHLAVAFGGYDTSKSPITTPFNIGGVSVGTGTKPTNGGSGNGGSGGGGGDIPVIPIDPEPNGTEPNGEAPVVNETIDPISGLIATSGIDWIRLEWTAPNNASKFVLYKNGIIMHNTTYLYYNFTNLEANTTYAFGVQAYNSNNCSNVTIIYANTLIPITDPNGNEPNGEEPNDDKKGTPAFLIILFILIVILVLITLVIIYNKMSEKNIEDDEEDEENDDTKKSNKNRNKL